jgi:signal recognition particle receptor subunit beta
MAFINYPLREISLKVVYYGPGLGGKTTNLEHIYEHTIPAAKGRMIELKTGSDRTLFFDFLPLEIGSVKGFKVRMHLYSVPGQVIYNASRQLILKGADGVVFVADSQVDREEANIISMENLHANLAEQGQSIATVPLCVQYNKRDLPHIAPVEVLRAQLNPTGVPDFEAAARSGAGVFETLRAAAKLVLLDFNQRNRPGAPGEPPAAETMSSPKQSAVSLRR